MSLLIGLTITYFLLVKGSFLIRICPVAASMPKKLAGAPDPLGESLFRIRYRISPFVPSSASRALT